MSSRKSAGGGEPSLNEAQQYFVQVMLNRGVVDELHFKRLFGAVLRKFEIVCPDGELKDFYTRFIKEINEAIRHFSMEIKRATCEFTTITSFCLVRLASGSADADIGQLSALYSPVELTIFKRLMALVVESDDGCVEYATAVQHISDDFDEQQAQLMQQSAATGTQLAAAATKKPSAREIRAAIERLTRDYWLADVVGRSHVLTLHPRAILELADYIKQMYANANDDEQTLTLAACHLCKSLVLHHVACDKCGARMHMHCANALFREQSKCGKCRATFDQAVIDDMREAMRTARQLYIAAHNN